MNVIKVIRPPILSCFSAKWLHGEHTTRGLPDYSGYRAGKENDKKLILDIWKLLNEANIVIGQNGDAFDLKMINTEFVKHRITPPSPYKTIDTLKTARRVFRFPSNKLDDLGVQLEEGRKLEHEGFGLWEKCMAGNMAAWKRYKEYNKQDVLLLERVYKRFMPWLTNPPPVWIEFKGMCAKPGCGSKNLLKRGTTLLKRGKKQWYQCKDCGGYTPGELIPNS